MTAETDAATIADLNSRLDQAVETSRSLRAEVERLARQVEQSRQWVQNVILAVGLIAIVAVGVVYTSASISHEDSILSHQKANASAIHQTEVELCAQRAALRLPSDTACSALTP